jgi:hypothetical protein
MKYRVGRGLELAGHRCFMTTINTFSSSHVGTVKYYHVAHVQGTFWDETWGDEELVEEQKR